jgi:diadenylate cyclase
MMIPVPLFITIGILDVIDIILVAILMYQAYRLIKGTVAINILVGIFLVYLFWLVVKALNMDLISSILGQVMTVGVIALIIVFQQEIRRFLLMIGSRYRTRSRINMEKLFPFLTAEKAPLDTTPVIDAVKSLSASKTGALIVIARESELTTIIETGDILNAEISSRLLESIFTKNSPLHDGAVIISGNRLLAARCILPVTENIYLPANYGMRHRAALGMAERTDSLVILVSEETGSISLAVESQITTDLDLNGLHKILDQMMKDNTSP